MIAVVGNHLFAARWISSSKTPVFYESLNTAVHSRLFVLKLSIGAYRVCLGTP